MAPDVKTSLQDLIKLRWIPYADPVAPWIFSELGEAEQIGLVRTTLEMNKSILEAQKAALDAQIVAHNKALDIVGKRQERK